MNIPNEIHANLTPAERIRAAVSAIARNDEDELQKLKDTCAKRQFIITTTDPDYSEGMVRLMRLAELVETEFRGVVLDIAIEAQLGVGAQFEMNQHFTMLATLQASWHTILDEKGIDRGDMAKVTEDLHHRAVKRFLQISDGMEDPEMVVYCAAWMRRIADNEY